MSTTFNRTQGVILIVDKAKTFPCRAASARALEQFQQWTSTSGTTAASSQATGQSHQHKKRHRGKQDFIKMGHAGTLDPMATGCLPVLLGQATKLQDHIPIDVKRYTAELRLGVKTDSDDADGTVVKTDEAFKGVPLDLDLEPFLNKFRGQIMQTPPIYSAIHIDGKRAYDLARAGQIPTMPPRQVYIHRFLASVVNEHTLKLDVTCGTGTYIRTLGTDLAKAIGTEGHLSKLRRISSGPFSVLTDRDESSGENTIMRVMSMREALETFVDIVDLTGQKQIQLDVLTGRSAQLFKGIKERVSYKMGDPVERKVALEWDNALRALVMVNFEKETVSSICHFKEDDTMSYLPTTFTRRCSSEVERMDELRVCQFNVLADGLAGKRPDGGGFSDTPRACLDWNFRSKRIIQEICKCRPHIVGLEELDRFDDVEKAFGDQFEFVYKCKPHSPCLEFSDKPDGCLLMFNKTRFERVNTEDESFALEGGSGNQVAACVVLKDTQRNGQIYVVCGAHFLSKKTEEGEVIRVIQAKSLIARLSHLSQKYGTTAVIVCADLNGTPNMDAYKHIIESGFRSGMKDSLGVGEEPPFTTAKQRGTSQVRHTIDYIFYSTTAPVGDSSAGNLRAVRHLEIPQDPVMLPSWQYPSDHYMLCVSFSSVD